MKKFIILQNNGEFIAIFHAAPHKIGEFQWYLRYEPDESTISVENASHFIEKVKTTTIDNAIFESISFSSEEIRKWLKGKWLGCVCKIEGEKNSYDEGYVYLTDDFIEIIKRNQFDSIEFFGEDGNIRGDVNYISGNHKTDKKEE